MNTRKHLQIVLQNILWWLVLQNILLLVSTVLFMCCTCLWYGHLHVIGNVEESSGGRLRVIGRVKESLGSVCDRDGVILHLLSRHFVLFLSRRRVQK